MPSHTVVEQGRLAIEKSRRVNPSRKKSKPSQPVFGTSSSFKGIGRGVPGDPRK